MKSKDTTVDAAESTPSKDVSPSHTPHCIATKEPSAWLERMTVFASQSLSLPLTARDDDPVRERAFQAHAAASVQEGIRKLDALGIKWQRPKDFYAEMVKGDAHMSRIKDHIQKNKQEILLRAQRRERRKQKKFHKQTKDTQAKQAQQGKRNLTVSLHAAKKDAKKWKAMGGDESEFNMDRYFDDAKKKGRQRKDKTKTSKRKKKFTNKKRKHSRK